MYKRIAAFLSALAVLFFLAAPVSAQELPDLQRTGSLTLWMDFEKEPLNGGSLTLYRVGDIVITDGNAGFSLIRELEDGPALTDLGDPGLAGELAALARSRDLPALAESIEAGWVVFAPLEPGLYVVTQRKSQATPGFDAIQPFLIGLPQWQDEGYVYDLTAAPKVPLVPGETLPTPPTEPTSPTEPTTPPPGTPELPQTGQLNWPVPVLAVSGMTLFVLGWALCFGSGRKHHEA